MISTGMKVEVDQVVKDPAAHFESPMVVTRDRRFTKDEKLRILEAWVHDAELLSQAEAENMPGPQRPRLREAKLALLEVQKQD